MVTPENLVRNELIGLEAKVVESTNKDAVGLEGTVTDETRNTITIRTSKGSRNLVKEQCIFSFLLSSGQRVKVDGNVIIGRPEDRIKKKLRRW